MFQDLKDVGSRFRLRVGSTVLAVLIGQLSYGQNLTDAEADAIVQRAADEQLAKEQARLALHPQFHVIERVETRTPGKVGGLILERVARPSLPSAPEPAPKISSSPKVQAPFDPVSRNLPLENLFLSGSVFGNELTEIRWRFEGVEYRAWSNVNFNYLRSAASFETENAIYSFLMVMDDQPLENLDRFVDQRSLKRLRNAASGSYFVENPTIPDAALFGLDALHEHYLANEAALIAAYDRQQALQAAKERYELANPTPAPTTVIRYWSTP